MREKYSVIYHRTTTEKNVQHLCISQHHQIKNCPSVTWQLQGWHRP